MEKTKSVWGGAAGKLIAALIIIALVFAVISAVLANSLYGDRLLSKDDIKVIGGTSSKDGTVSVKFRITKPGNYLSACKTRKSGDKLMVKLYSSLTESSYKADTSGIYTLDFSVDADLKNVVQEGHGGEEYILLKVNIDE